MAHWQRTLSLEDVWDIETNGLTVQHIATVAAERLRKLEPFVFYTSLDNERHEIADEFESLAGDPDADEDDFNLVMSRLYDWGDTALDAHWNGRKACWIKTF